MRSKPTAFGKQVDVEATETTTSTESAEPAAVKVEMGGAAAGPLNGNGKAAPAPPPVKQSLPLAVVLPWALIAALSCTVVGLAVGLASSKSSSCSQAAPLPAASAAAGFHIGSNPCEGKKPKHAAPGDNYFSNVECVVDGVRQALEQAGANVTQGFKGKIDASSRPPITEPYWKVGLCPVNVHWHLGAEHLSEGEYDTRGKGPADHSIGIADEQFEDGLSRRQLKAAGARKGLQCHKYSPADPKFTTPYEWKHCVDTHVGETYEVHWPHSAAGACGTPFQYQTPFYDGVFCTDGIISLDPLNTFQKIGVQAQVFTVVNDESYYYPDLIRGMIVDGAKGADIAKYTGSTTGTSRDNKICSRYTPITWQVDRKCHLISASSFDKLCADMKAQRDDLSGDLHPHGARELVAARHSANNLQRA